MSLKDKIGVFVVTEVITILLFGGVCGLFGMSSDWTWNSFRAFLLPGMIVGGLVGVFLFFQVKGDAEADTQRKKKETQQVINQQSAETSNHVVSSRDLQSQPEIIIGMTLDEVIRQIGQPRDEGVSGADILGPNTTDSRTADVFLSFENHPDLDYSIRFSQGKVASVKTYAKRQS